jgi:general secretion pathway protein A
MMFLEHFGLIEQPFGVTPDPRFLHLGPKHREALASLHYGVENDRGFLALIAPPGMGKTAMLFHFLENVRNQARTAFLFQAAGDSRDFMRYLLTDLGIESSTVDLPGMHNKLNQLLAEEMRAGRRLILVIDEAQNLGERVLESIRLLSNFETPWMKLLQIVMAGQPQLAECLARPAMSQLRQRISSVIRIGPFTTQETSAYIDHRLWVAGYAGPTLFTVGARLLIGQHSGGIPRNINNLCFHSMALASAMGEKQVSSEMVREAINDLSIASNRIDPSRPQAPLAAASDVTFYLSPARKDTNRAPLTASANGGGLLIRAMVTACAVLFLGLVSGASWKTDVGSLPSANPPTPNAAVFPASMTSIESAPETPLSRSVAPVSIAGTKSEPSEWPRSEHAVPDRLVTPITVTRGTTLRHLSLLYLDRFDQQTLAEICRLNPTITDPNQIDAGMRIRLPVYLRRDAPIEVATIDGRLMGLGQRANASKVQP